jgi:hypothetical protein
MINISLHNYHRELGQRIMADSFFLDPDEAKTLGNLDYMRTTKKVRKTYPTTKAWGEGFAEETQTSAMKKVKPTNPESIETGDVKVPEEVKQEISERRRASSDMDMFRNMAKNIRKD